RAELAGTVLKAGHHGSKTSTSPGFLAVVNPQVAVVSVGANNRLGHPGTEVMERLKARTGAERVYRTDLNGTVEFITDGRRLWVKTDR
ncbi:MAG: hypothetical protein Q7R57_00140, partial [Dehalococcoidales bacterium]|nr:hypothetical protein [Dehalococcoidales bacterium]